MSIFDKKKKYPVKYSIQSELLKNALEEIKDNNIGLGKKVLEGFVGKFLMDNLNNIKIDFENKTIYLKEKEGKK